MSRVGPDGKRFVWGKIIETHGIGRYEIVEAEAKPGAPTVFHPYIDGIDASWYSETLDAALLMAIAIAHGGRRDAEHAARYMAKIAGMTT